MSEFNLTKDSNDNSDRKKRRDKDMINDRLVDEWIGSMYTENGVYNSDSDGSIQRMNSAPEVNAAIDFTDLP